MRLNFNKFFLIDLLISLILLILTLYICRFFLSPQLIEGHDGSGAFVKVLAMVDMINRHQWDFSWQPNLYLGHGYPLFTFYPPLFYIIASFSAVLFNDIILGLNAAVVLVYFLSGVAMYFCAREFWGRSGGLLSAVAYLSAPYHILNLYVRNAYAEMTSFIFLPLILWCVYKVTIATRKRYYFGVVFSIAALVLTHVLMSMIFIPIVCIWGIMLLILTSEKKKGFKVISAVILGLGVTTFFWLSIVFLKPLVNTDALIQGFNFRDHFIQWWQMLKPSWGFGDTLKGDQDGMSFQLGWAHIVLFVAAVAYVWGKAWPQALKRHQLFFVLVLFMMGVAVLMCLPYSQGIWERLAPLHFLQFPWRFLGLATLGMCFFTGAVCIKDDLKAWAVAILGVFLLCVLNFGYCYSPNLRPLSIKSSNELASQIRNLDMNEYLPRWVKQIPLSRPSQEIELMRHQKILNVSGSSLLHRTFRIDPLGDEDIAVFHGFYFPGWDVIIDGKKQEITPVQGSGLIACVVPKSSQIIEIKYSMTALRLISACISMIFIGAMLGWLINARIRKLKAV